jgi:RNA recognition motif-containing protein
MGKELYVGHMSYDTTEYDLENLFSVSGRVTSVHLITDAQTGEFKGCGYVRMSTEAEAKDAIASLDGALLIDKKITVSEARPQKHTTPGGYKGKSAAAGRPGGKSAAGYFKGPAANSGKAAGSKGPASTAPAKGGFAKSGAPAGKPRSGKR